MLQLKEGISVQFKKPGDKHLSRDVVIGKHETPRSYTINDETGREYCRNRRHIHVTREPPVTILNDLSNESEPITMQSIVNSPSITSESDANPEPDPPDTNASLVPLHSTWLRSVLVRHKDHVM